MKKILVAVLVSTASVAFAGCASSTGEDTSATEAELTTSQTVTCQSWNYQYATCDVDTHGGQIVGVRVARQLSSPQGACNEGQSFGIGDHNLWVDHGCRADFEVTISSSGGGNRATINCASNGYQYATCSSPIGNINSIRLLHQDSSSACTEGSSFGYYSDAIWVDHGCRGTFEVTGWGGHSGQGDITLFEHDNFGGRTLHLTDRQDNFDPIRFNDMVSSLIVRRGTWELCTDAYFNGVCTQYQPGEYRSVGGFYNDKFSSARLVGW